MGIDTETSKQSIAPHGGTLIDRLVQGAEAAEVRQRGAALPAVQLSARQVNDLELIAIGTLSPLRGFMGKADYEHVVEDLHLANGLPWTIPVTLAVAESDAPTEGADVALRDPAGELRGIMLVEEIFSRDVKR
ncbi:MAG: sulfate adenylyltransferase, partial [Chloroflexota bacterium]